MSGKLGRGGGPVTTVVTRTAPALDARAVFARAAGGVVDISATGTVAEPGAGAFGDPTSSRQDVTGTGFVADERGDIVTAGHVVAGAQRITVTLPDGVSRSARVLGRDEVTDIAVLAVRGGERSLRPLRLGSSRGLRVGDAIAAI